MLNPFFCVTLASLTFAINKRALLKSAIVKFTLARARVRVSTWAHVWFYLLKNLTFSRVHFHLASHKIRWNWEKRAIETHTHTRWAQLKIQRSICANTFYLVDRVNRIIDSKMMFCVNTTHPNRPIISKSISASLSVLFRLDSLSAPFCIYYICSLFISINLCMFLCYLI